MYQKLAFAYAANRHGQAVEKGSGECQACLQVSILRIVY